MAFGVQSIDRQSLKNNVVGLAKAAKTFNIPATITAVETASFSGNTFPELLSVFPENETLERSSMNSWDDQNVRDALAKHAANGRKKIVVSGLWTEVCNLSFALSPKPFALSLIILRVSSPLSGANKILKIAPAAKPATKATATYPLLLDLFVNFDINFPYFIVLVF